MLSNTYLYGTDKVPNIPLTVCNERIKLLKDNLSVLMDKDYKDRDDSRINKVFEGIEFWSRLRDRKVT